MMDISVPAGAADAAAGAKANRPAGKGSDADGSGGFSDVLNKANAGSDRNQGAKADGQQPSGTADGGNGAVGSAPHRQNPKAVIDLGNSAALAQAEADATAVNAGKDTQKTGRVDIKSLRKQIDDAAVDGAAEDVADKIATPTSKDDKTGKPVKTEAKPGSADDSAVSDVLSMLGNAPVDSASVAAAALFGQKAQDTAPTDAKDKSSGKQKTKGDAVADVASALTSATDAASDVDMPGATAAGDAVGQTFRLTRADSRGTSMDMHLGIEKDAADVGGKANVETVTILDSRRYIGLAQNTNSAAVTAAIAGDKEWAHAMQASSSLSNAAELSSTGKVVNTLKIQMNPIDLGLVTATLRLQGDTLNVDLKVETAAAYRQLREDHTKMLESLRSQGYAIDGVSVSMAPVANTYTSSQANAQSGSQQGSAQGQGGEARERQNQTGQRSTGGFNVTGESDATSASSGSSGSSGTGDVYL